MWFPTIFFNVTIDIVMFTMVTWILALMCSGCHLLIFPFPLLLPLLGRILVFFLLGTTFLSFLVAYVFQIVCFHTGLINFLGLEEHHLLSQMIV
jgi:hypothetical protein